MNVLMCPVCGCGLEKNDNKYICKKNHSFDISRKGYVNLLMSNSSGEKRHGDDKMMVEARRDFLNLGYYKPLANKISDIAIDFVEKNNQKENLSVFECGCGDCYYMSVLKERFSEKSVKASIIGCDISKEVLPYGKKRMGNATLFVASAARIPLMNNSVDIALSIFAPSNMDEFSRIVKKHSLVIKVIPLENHLIQLKEVLYDKVYLNRPVVDKHDDFELISESACEYKFNVTGGKDLENLFRMTPYYYKTSAEAQKKILSVEKMEITASFGILCYKKLK